MIHNKSYEELQETHTRRERTELHKLSLLEKP